MTVGLVGKKSGMTRIFSADGVSTPVTVVEIEPNRITQLKTEAVDGYVAIQVTRGQRKASKVNKPLAGHYAKANVEAGSGLWEFRLEDDQVFSKKELKIGDLLAINDVFKEGQMIDVCGTTKGKGFAGTIKRHHFHGQDATHGNSLSHRVPGSIGQNQTPGRVFKGHKMAGHLGNKARTIQNQRVIKIDADRNLLLVEGAVPGAPGGIVVVMPAVKVKGE